MSLFMQYQNKAIIDNSISFANEKNPLTVHQFAFKFEPKNTKQNILTLIEIFDKCPNWKNAHKEIYNDLFHSCKHWNSYTNWRISTVCHQLDKLFDNNVLLSNQFYNGLDIFNIIVIEFGNEFMVEFSTNYLGHSKICEMLNTLVDKDFNLIPWDFVEAFYPKYSDSSEILYNNDLCKIVNKEFEDGDEAHKLFIKDFNEDYETANQKYILSSTDIYKKAIKRFWFK